MKGRRLSLRKLAQVRPSPVVMGVDVAAPGTDRTVITTLPMDENTLLRSFGVLGDGVGIRTESNSFDGRATQYSFTVQVERDIAGYGCIFSIAVRSGTGTPHRGRVFVTQERIDDAMSMSNFIDSLASDLLTHLANAARLDMEDMLRRLISRGRRS